LKQAAVGQRKNIEHGKLLEIKPKRVDVDKEEVPSATLWGVGRARQFLPAPYHGVNEMQPPK
jgi:hypothetical protein